MRLPTDGDLDPDTLETNVERQGLKPRAIGWVYVACGVVGFTMAFVLLLERLRLLDDPSYIPTCNIGERLNCGTVMASDQADTFGFPNPIVGVAGFPVVATIGVVLLAGVALPRWFRLATQAGVTAAGLFVHWLIFQSVVRIGALCPYCMVVWVVTITLAWYTTLHTLATTEQPSRWIRRLTAAGVDSHAVGVMFWLLGVAVFILLFL